MSRKQRTASSGVRKTGMFPFSRFPTPSSTASSPIQEARIGFESWSPMISLATSVGSVMVCGVRMTRIPSTPLSSRQSWTARL